MFKYSFIKSLAFGTLGFLSLALISISSLVFAQEDMILVADNSFNTSHLVNKYVKVSPSLNSVKVVRNYKNQVDFGSDPITDEIWYPHKSATINYYVNCELGKFQSNPGSFMKIIMLVVKLYGPIKFLEIYHFIRQVLTKN